MQKLQRENKKRAIENSCWKSQMQKMRKKIFQTIKEEMIFMLPSKTREKENLSDH